ncbi:MAG: hypothetical protein JO304_20020 [Solirubrobacterales bacterium]|nr:hypothetical protein [Solirubrobacterales bacterium]
MKWTTLTTPLVLLLGLVAPSAVLADGGPVGPVHGSAIGVAGSPYQYAAFAAGRGTIVKQLQAGAAAIASELRVAGQYGIPAVDYSGSTTGLSADGRTLVLVEIPGNVPPRRTRLLMLDAMPRLGLRARLSLPGWWTVDAISPNGRWLYLIHYTSSNVLSYEVRAYDLLARQLDPRPVVDPRERDEAMTGFALTRVMSAGGRWAYTLYARPTGVPFVHALDTVGRRAVCVDLPSLNSSDIGNPDLRLTPGGRTLQIDIGGVTQAAVDTRTFAVSTAAPQAVPISTRSVRREAPTAHATGGVPWELIAGLIAVLGALTAILALAARRRRRDHPAPSPASSAPDAPARVGEP